MTDRTVLGLPTDRQVRMVDVRLEVIDGGKLRVTVAGARGWAAVAATEKELLLSLRQAWTEAQVRAYAAWRGEAYDQDELTDVVPGDPATEVPRYPQVVWGTRVRSDVYSADAWVPLEDGRWRSPGGRVFRADTQVVRRVMANRSRPPLVPPNHGG